jgi:hypothetical protein
MSPTVALYGLVRTAHRIAKEMSRQKPPARAHRGGLKSAALQCGEVWGGWDQEGGLEGCATHSQPWFPCEQQLAATTGREQTRILALGRIQGKTALASPTRQLPRRKMGLALKPRGGSSCQHTHWCRPPWEWPEKRSCAP